MSLLDTNPTSKFFVSTAFSTDAAPTPQSTFSTPLPISPYPTSPNLIPFSPSSIAFNPETHSSAPSLTPPESTAQISNRTTVATNDSQSNVRSYFYLIFHVQHNLTLPLSFLRGNDSRVTWKTLLTKFKYIHSENLLTIFFLCFLFAHFLTLLIRPCLNLRFSLSLSFSFTDIVNSRQPKCSLSCTYDSDHEHVICKFSHFFIHVTFK
jgi:hypothetical protein